PNVVTELPKPLFKKPKLRDNYSAAGLDCEDGAMLRRPGTAAQKSKKAVLKQQFEAFTISSKESLEKGYDRFQKLLSQLEALGAGVSDKDANHKFLSRHPPVIGQPKPLQASISISQATARSLVSYTTTPLFKSKTKLSIYLVLLMKFIHSFLATKLLIDVDLIHEDLDQIDELGIKNFYKNTAVRPRVDGKMHVAYDKRKFECFNCHNTGHFARECKFKSTKDGSKQEAGREAVLVAHKLAVKKLESQLKASHKQQSSLTEKLNFQANQIFEKDEKLKKYRRIGMKAVKDKDALQKIVDSWSTSSKNL
ncbi:ribonuclease H-like domain-containing protein, partial [Tanacetum coccineum]